MAETIRTFNSIKEISETIDEELSQTKSKLGEYLRELDDIRTLAEKSKRIHEIVLNLAGKKNGSNENLDEVQVGGFNIVLDATPFHQMAIIESAVKSHQERLTVLQKTREGLTSLDQLGDTEGLTIIVLENQGIPSRVLLKTS